MKESNGTFMMMCVRGRANNETRRPVSFIDSLLCTLWRREEERMHMIVFATAFDNDEL
jgi:hypothetical protein